MAEKIDVARDETTDNPHNPQPSKRPVKSCADLSEQARELISILIAEEEG